MAEMTHEYAWELLQKLSKQKGRLRFICATHKCLGETCNESRTNAVNHKGVPTTDAELAYCTEYATMHSDKTYSNPLADPAHYHLHDITGVNDKPRGYEGRGLVEATTDEGDRCVGYPAHVLKRVTQAVNVF